MGCVRAPRRSDPGGQRAAAPLTAPPRPHLLMSPGPAGRRPRTAGWARWVEPAPPRPLRRPAPWQPRLAAGWGPYGDAARRRHAVWGHAGTRLARRAARRASGRPSCRWAPPRAGRGPVGGTAWRPPRLISAPRSAFYRQGGGPPWPRREQDVFSEPPPRLQLGPEPASMRPGSQPHPAPAAPRPYADRRGTPSAPPAPPTRPNDTRGSLACRTPPKARPESPWMQRGRPGLAAGSASKCRHRHTNTALRLTTP